MRKFVIFVLMSAWAATTWDAESSACWRRRCRCYRQAQCVATCYSFPASQAAPTPFGVVRAQVISTESFTSPRGRVYRIHQTNHEDAHEQVVAPEIVPESTTAGDNFKGTDRKAAKTSLATAAVQSYPNIDALLATLPPDDEMIQNPAITKAPDSQRVAAEQRNVSVPAFLYASSKEADNDYHLVIGGPDALSSGHFMNAEISGLPTGTFRNQLQVPRQAYKDYFGSKIPGRKYSIYDPPIPITLTGSLFYDIDHAPGVVGPGDYKPQTSWEIHPIAQISFEP